MLAFRRHVVAIFEPCCVLFKSLYTRPKRNTPLLDHVGTMLDVYGAYVGPMLIHVRLLEAMLGTYSSHVELMLSQGGVFLLRTPILKVLRAGNLLR